MGAIIDSILIAPFAFFRRRLNPEMSFFQQATEYPCKSVVNSGGRKRLHRRVHNSLLNSANVERKGLGPTTVSVLLSTNFPNNDGWVFDVLSRLLEKNISNRIMALLLNIY